MIEKQVIYDRFFQFHTTAFNKYPTYEFIVMCAILFFRAFERKQREREVSYYIRVFNNKHVKMSTYYTMLFLIAFYCCIALYHIILCYAISVV